MAQLTGKMFDHVGLYAYLLQVQGMPENLLPGGRAVYSVGQAWWDIEMGASGG